MATGTPQQTPGFFGRIASMLFKPANDSGRRPAAAPKTQAQAELTEEDGPASIEPFAEVLGLEVTEPEPLTADEAELVQSLSTQVLDRLKSQETPPVAMPTASLRIINLVAKGAPDVGELARVVSSDPAIAAAVLRTANSAANASLGEQTSMREVIARLGTREVGRVAGVVAAHTLFNPRAKAEYALFPARWAALHLDAAGCAAGAAYLAMELGRGRSDTAYLGGMLHDIGKSLSLGAFAALVIDGQLAEVPPAAVVDAVLEKVHVDVGADVHAQWSLPDDLTALCASHHDEEVPDTETYAETHLVRVIAGLIALRHTPYPLHDSSALLQSIQTLGISPRQLRAIDTELTKLVTRAREAAAA